MSTHSTRSLFTVAEIVMLPEFSFLTESGLRHMIYNASQPVKARRGAAGEGMVEQGVLCKVGRRVLIHLIRFRAYLEQAPANKQ